MQKPDTPPVRIKLAWFAAPILALLAVAAAALFYKGSPTRPAVASKARLSIEIGQSKLLVPALLVRNPDRRVSGRTARLDLMMQWPDFEPPTPPTPKEAEDRPQNAVFVSIEPADSAINPSQRPKELYARFLLPEVETGPGTLLRRGFKPGSAYGGEYLAIAPPDGEIFSARCLANESVESASARCLWQFRYGDLDILVRFSPVILPNWERLNDHVRQLIQRVYLEQ